MHIFILQGITKAFQCIPVLSNMLLKIFHNLRYKNITHCQIWNRQFHPSSFCSPSLCQIASCKKQAPDIVDRLIDFWICEFLVNFLCNYLTCHKTLDFPFCSSICGFLDKTFYCVIAAGVDPIIVRLYIWLASNPVTMVQHIPRTIQLRISKLIAIVPFFYCLIMVCQIIIRQKLLHFLIGKAKKFVKTLICNR